MQQPNSALERDNDCGESTREHYYDRGCSCEQCMMKRESNLEVEVDTDGPSVKRHRTETVKHEVMTADGHGDDAEALKEGELDVGGQQIGGGGGSVQSDQMNDEQNVNVIREEGPTQLSVDISSADGQLDQIEQSQHDQEEHRLADLEHELQMLRNVFMKPIDNGQFGGQFLCDYPKCGKRFGPDEQEQLAHLKVHTKPYVCDFGGCLRRFTYPTAYTRHKKTHTVNVLQCDLPGCVKRFKNIGNLNLHKRDHTDPMVWFCGWADCDKVYYSEGNYQSHYLTHSDDGIPDHQLVCDWVDCALKFTTQFNFSIHRRLHTDKRNASSSHLK